MKGKLICIGIIAVILSVLVIAAEDIIRIDSGSKKELYDGELILNYCREYNCISYKNVLHVNEYRKTEPTIGNEIFSYFKNADYSKKYKVTIVDVVDISKRNPRFHDVCAEGQVICKAGYVEFKAELVPRCGDNICNGDENCKTCSDCGSCIPYCGDGVCQDFEACNTCDEDCGECERVCGDGKCSYDEPTTCPEDCDPSLHSPGVSGGGGGGGSTQVIFCGDGICDINESYGSCPDDCERPIICGDNICDIDEDCCIDCGCEDNFECINKSCILLYECVNDYDCSDNETCINNECVTISEPIQDNESNQSIISNLTANQISNLEGENQTADSRHEENTQIQTEKNVGIIQVIVNWFKGWFR